MYMARHQAQCMHNTLQNTQTQKNTETTDKECNRTQGIQQSMENECMAACSYMSLCTVIAWYTHKIYCIPHHRDIPVTTRWH